MIDLLRKHVLPQACLLELKLYSDESLCQQIIKLLDITVKYLIYYNMSIHKFAKNQS